MVKSRGMAAVVPLNIWWYMGRDYDIMSVSEKNELARKTLNT